MKHFYSFNPFFILLPFTLLLASPTDESKEIASESHLDNHLVAADQLEEEKEAITLDDEEEEIKESLWGKHGKRAALALPILTLLLAWRVLSYIWEPKKLKKDLLLSGGSTEANLVRLIRVLSRGHWGQKECRDYMSALWTEKKRGFAQEELDEEAGLRHWVDYCVITDRLNNSPDLSHLDIEPLCLSPEFDMKTRLFTLFNDLILSDRLQSFVTEIQKERNEDQSTYISISAVRSRLKLICKSYDDDRAAQEVLLKGYFDDERIQTMDPNLAVFSDWFTQSDLYLNIKRFVDTILDGDDSYTASFFEQEWETKIQYYIEQHNDICSDIQFPEKEYQDALQEKIDAYHSELPQKLTKKRKLFSFLDACGQDEKLKKWEEFTANHYDLYRTTIDFLIQSPHYSTTDYTKEKAEKYYGKIVTNMNRKQMLEDFFDICSKYGLPKFRKTEDKDINLEQKLLEPLKNIRKEKFSELLYIDDEDKILVFQGNEKGLGISEAMRDFKKKCEELQNLDEHVLLVRGIVNGDLESPLTIPSTINVNNLFAKIHTETNGLIAKVPHAIGDQYAAADEEDEQKYPEKGEEDGIPAVNNNFDDRVTQYVRQLLCLQAIAQIPSLRKEIQKKIDEMIEKEKNNLLQQIDEKKKSSTMRVFLEEVKLALKSQSDPGLLTLAHIIISSHEIFKAAALSAYHVKLNKQPLDKLLEQFKEDMFCGKKEKEEEEIAEKICLNTKELFTLFVEKYNRYLDSILYSEDKKSCLQEDERKKKKEKLRMKANEMTPNNNSEILDYLALIASRWTLSDNLRFHDQSYTLSLEKNKDDIAEARKHAFLFIRYLANPQILSLLLLTGAALGEEEKDILEAVPTIRNVIAQMGTGEGKSVVLALLAMVLSKMKNREVWVACYNRYLSDRDYEDFKKLFADFGFQEQILYGTMNQICEHVINDKINLREGLLSWMNGDDTPISKRKDDSGDDDRPILLIDEVDVLFGFLFYGRKYIPGISITNDDIKTLTQEIASTYLSNLDREVDLSVIKQWPSYQNVNTRFGKGEAPIRNFFEVSLKITLTYLEQVRVKIKKCQETAKEKLVDQLQTDFYRLLLQNNEWTLPADYQTNEECTLDSFMSSVIEQTWVLWKEMHPKILKEKNEEWNGNLKKLFINSVKTAWKSTLEHNPHILTTKHSSLEEWFKGNTTLAYNPTQQLPITYTLTAQYLAMEFHPHEEKHWGDSLKYDYIVAQRRAIDCELETTLKNHEEATIWEKNWVEEVKKDYQIVTSKKNGIQYYQRDTLQSEVVNPGTYWLAYWLHEKEDLITTEYLQSLSGKLNLIAGVFLYNQIKDNHFAFMLGLTGSVESLTREQINILQEWGFDKNKYKIPSIFINQNRTNIFFEHSTSTSGVEQTLETWKSQIFRGEKKYYRFVFSSRSYRKKEEHLARERRDIHHEAIYKRMLEQAGYEKKDVQEHEAIKGVPVIVFFDTKDDLESFHHYFVNRMLKEKEKAWYETQMVYQIMGLEANILYQYNETATSFQGEEVANLFALTHNASALTIHGYGKITLALKEKGARGVDFKVENRGIDAKGGVSLIVTFVEENPSLQVQIRGRTARQGGAGSIYYIISQEEEQTKYGLDDYKIKHCKSKKAIYLKLRQEADKQFDERLNCIKTTLSSSSDSKKKKDHRTEEKIIDHKTADSLEPLQEDPLTQSSELQQALLIYYRATSDETGKEERERASQTIKKMLHALNKSIELTRTNLNLCFAIDATISTSTVIKSLSKEIGKAVRSLQQMFHCMGIWNDDKLKVSIRVIAYRNYNAILGTGEALWTNEFVEEEIEAISEDIKKSRKEKESQADPQNEMAVPADPIKFTRAERTRIKQGRIFFGYCKKNSILRILKTSKIADDKESKTSKTDITKRVDMVNASITKRITQLEPGGYQLFKPGIVEASEWLTIDEVAPYLTKLSSERICGGYGSEAIEVALAAILASVPRSKLKEAREIWNDREKKGELSHPYNQWMTEEDELRFPENPNPLPLPKIEGDEDDEKKDDVKEMEEHPIPDMIFLVGDRKSQSKGQITSLITDAFDKKSHLMHIHRANLDLIIRYPNLLPFLFPQMSKKSEKGPEEKSEEGPEEGADYLSKFKDQTTINTGQVLRKLINNLNIPIHSFLYSTHPTIQQDMVFLGKNYFDSYSRYPFLPCKNIVKEAWKDFENFSFFTNGTQDIYKKRFEKQIATLMWPTLSTLSLQDLEKIQAQWEQQISL